MPSAPRGGTLFSALDTTDRENPRALLQGISEGHIYKAALTLMMRLVFLFSAEERNLLPVTNPVYRALCSAINDSGTAVGYYVDSSGVSHGFTRGRFGPVAEIGGRGGAAQRPALAVPPYSRLRPKARDRSDN
jgi:hypothetical protein